jgi:N-methylhydantoinase A
VFHLEHARIYGYSLPERDVEVVTVRVRTRSRAPQPRLVRPASQKGKAELRRVWISGSWRRIPVWNREQLAKTRRDGPALVLDYGSTTLVPPGWRFRVDSAGNLLIQF